MSARCSEASPAARSPHAWWATACSTRISITLPNLPPASAAAQEALQQSGRVLEGALRTLCCVLSQEHSGEGDVLELVQVAEVVVDGQAGLTDPVKRVIQMP